jgi:hypothetical protein
MRSANSNLELLFAQLKWPSLMVRERAAMQIAELLKDLGLRGVIGEALIAWLSSQELESLAANMLVIPLRLKADGSEVFPDVARFIAAIHYPSVLSHLLIAELRDDWTESFQWRGWHSGPAPNTFTSSSYFERYKTGFLPPIYVEHAKSIEKDFLLPFQRQWAYEWERILERTGLPMSAPPYYFIQHYNQTHVYFEVSQSDVYRSAYLRALAWAVDEGDLPVDLARIRALECCPIDIGVWKIQPSPRPNWWPYVVASENDLDTTPGQIWPQMEALWREQQRSNTEQLLVHASGHIISAENAVYDLEIHGAFQRFEGGQEPVLEEVVEWLAWQHSVLPSQVTVTLSGQIRPEPFNKYVRQFLGWSLAPAAFRVRTWATARWQAPQTYRGIWTAAPYLIEPGNGLVCDSESLRLESNNCTVAQWQIWHDHLEERWYAHVPPGVGECLWIERGLIQNFCEATRANFCWIVRLRFYHRRYSSETFKSVDGIRAFGASSIFR